MGESFFAFCETDFQSTEWDFQSKNLVILLHKRQNLNPILSF